MTHGRAQRHEYWAERFKKAETDPDEARKLLTLFAELAEHPRIEGEETESASCPAEGADPLLVQWVAQRIKAWADAGFGRDQAPQAFGTKKAPNAPKSIRAADKRAKALAEVHRLNRLEGLPLPEAFEAAGRLANLSPHQVRDDYEAFRGMWREGGGEVAEWLPVLMRLPDADRRRAIAEGRVGRPKKGKSPG